MELVWVLGRVLVRRVNFPFRPIGFVGSSLLKPIPSYDQPENGPQPYSIMLLSLRGTTTFEKAAPRIRLPIHNSSMHYTFGFSLTKEKLGILLHKRNSGGLIQNGISLYGT